MPSLVEGPRCSGIADIFLFSLCIGGMVVPWFISGFLAVSDLECRAVITRTHVDFLGHSHDSLFFTIMRIRYYALNKTFIDFLSSRENTFGVNEFFLKKKQVSWFDIYIYNRHRVVIHNRARIPAIPNPTNASSLIIPKEKTSSFPHACIYVFKDSVWKRRKVSRQQNTRRKGHS